METPMSDVLWCIHVYGPDDLIAQPSRDVAIERARTWAEAMRGVNELAATDLLTPAVGFGVEPWPYSAESHAEDLQKRDGKYEG